jgi:chromosome segregation ATPase
VEENKSIKERIMELENTAGLAEKKADEFSQKFYKAELQLKDSEIIKNSLKTDYEQLKIEVADLREKEKGRFELEQKLMAKNKEFSDQNEELTKLKSLLEEKLNLVQNLQTHEQAMEKELCELRGEAQNGQKVKALEESIAKINQIAQSQDEENKVKSKKIGELTVELEDTKTKYVNIKVEYEEYQASQELVKKKNEIDIKEIKRQYNKEKENREQMVQIRQKLENEVKDFKEKIELMQRKQVPSKPVSSKEKGIVEALSSKLETIYAENETMKQKLSESQKKIDYFEQESKVKTQLLVSYASKYAQDHLEEYKERYVFCYITGDKNVYRKLEPLDEAYITEVLKSGEEKKNTVLMVKFGYKDIIS